MFLCIRDVILVFIKYFLHVSLYFKPSLTNLKYSFNLKFAKPIFALKFQIFLKIEFMSNQLKQIIRCNFRFRKLLIYNTTFPLLHIQNHSFFIPNLNNDIGRVRRKIRLPKVRFKPNVDFSCFGESLEQLYSTYNFIFDELHVAKLHKKLLSKKSLKG